MAELSELDSNSKAVLISAELEQAVLRLTLSNPPANVLSVDLMGALETALAAARRDTRVRVIVLAASGKLFSAGHDLKELTSHRADADDGKAFFQHVFAVCARLMQSVANCPKPTIAEVDGIATAAGCQLIASCDLAVASDRSKFGVNGIDVGLFCTSPAVALMRVISRKRAMEMLLTGEMIDAATAREFGLVNRVVPRQALRENVDELARTISEKPPLAVKLGKDAVNREVGMDLAQAYEHASSVMVENLMTSDAAAGIDAFLQHRKAPWQAN